MKILWLLTTTNFSYINGGNLKHILYWWKEISKYKNIKCALVLSSPNINDLTSLVAEYESYGLKTYGIPELYPIQRALCKEARNAFKEVITKEKPDIVHSLLIQSDLIAAYYKPLFGYKIVSSFEGLLFPNKPTHKFLTYYILNKYLRRRIDVNVSISEYTLRENKLKGFVGNNKNLVIYSGLDIKSYNDLYKKRDPHHINICYLANISQGKLPLLFVKTAEALIKKHHNLKFHIGGTGCDLPKIKNYVEEHGLSDHITFYGFVKDVQHFFSQMDFLIFTSEREGLPWTILEAMASKLPVIASPVGGVPEIVKDNVNGYLLEENTVECIVEKVEKLINNNTLIESMSQNAFDTVYKNFTSRIEVNKFISLYQSLKK